ncbi:MAG: hypothetical protein ACK4UN_21705, partial [Limisphaerales bacterium]
FDDVLKKGTLPDRYRPTVYDFIAHEALAFYTSGEQAAAKPQDAFRIPADSPIFGEAEEFINWRPDTGDTNSPAYKAVVLFQQLLRFHQEDADPTAFVDVNIERLVYGKNVAIGENKNERFKAALRAVAERWNKHELAALALFHVANTLREEDDLVAAHQLANSTAIDYRNTNGGQLCLSLVSEIEAKSARIITERVWNTPAATIQVRYKNVERVYFRAIPYDWSAFVNKHRRMPEYLDDKQRQEVLDSKATLEWSHPLPATSDFKERTVTFDAPTRLKPGSYFIVASHRQDFAEKANQLSITDVWMSDLAFIIRPREQFMEGFVLQANSGEPIKGARVDGWYQDYRQNRLVAIEPVQTDANGMFQLKLQQGQNYIFRARDGEQEIGARHQVYPR